MTIPTVEETILSSSPRVLHKFRCITPESTVELDYDDSDDDDSSIPHLLKPNSSSDQEDSDSEFEEIEVSTPYLSRRFDLMNASPITSISSLSQDGGIINNNITTAIKGPSMHRKKKNSKLSFRLDDEYLEGPHELTNKSSTRKMQLTPRKLEDHKALSSPLLSPIPRSSSTTVGVLQVPCSPPISSKRLSQKHRRSVSQPGAKNMKHESKLSTLKEGCESSDFGIPMMSIQFMPQVDQLQDNMYTHRRTLSFPDQIVDAIGSQQPLYALRSLRPFTDLSPDVNDPSMIRIGSKVYVSIDSVDVGSAVSFESYASDYSNSTGKQVQHRDDQVKAARYKEQGTSPSSHRTYSEEEIALAWKNMSHQDESGSKKETKHKKGKVRFRRRGSPSNGMVENSNAMNEASSSKKNRNRKERNRGSCVLQ